MAVLERNWTSVVETADALLEHETLSGVALEALLSTVELMPIAGDLPRKDPRATDAQPGDSD